MITDKTTYYHLILDESRSMNDCRQETIDAFNDQIKSICSIQAEFPCQTIRISFTTFNNKINHHYFDKSVGVVQKLEEENYVPQDNTALFDAIGEGIFRLIAEHRSELLEKLASGVLVIITDGLENASKYFDLQTLKRIIASVSNEYTISFSFLGSNADSVRQGQNLGINNHDIKQYSKDNVGTVFRHISFCTKKYMYGKSKGETPTTFLSDSD